MKLMEVIIWFFILAVVLAGATALFTSSKLKLKSYVQSVEQDSVKISLYNYSKDLIETINSNQTWYILFSWTHYMTWIQWDYYYSCNLTWWYLIDIAKAYTWVFCDISVNWEFVHNFKLIQ